MSLLAYVNGLAAKGVELWASDGKLQYKAPKELITAEFLGELKQKKAELIELLREFAASTGTYPLSYSQKSLWSLHQLNPQSAAYNVMYAAQLSDDLQIDTLRRCFDYLIARHPILRTRYSVIDGQPQQKVETAASTEIDVHEAGDADEASIHDWIDREANKPFDLSVSPIRLKLFVHQAAGKAHGRSMPRHVLLINVHHIAADFWSLEIFVRELSLLHRMAIGGQTLKLPPIKLQYKDCVQREIDRLQGTEGAALSGFWERELQGELPVLKLPADFVRPPVKTENGKVFALDLGESLTRAIKEAAKANEVTPYMLLLGVYQLFLFLHSGQRRVLIGAPTAGRDVGGSEAIMGHFVNTVVLSCRLDGNARFADLLTDTRSMMVRVLEHQHYPFPLLVERMRPERDPSRSPVFQVMYNWNQAQRESREQIEGAEFNLVQGMLAASSTGTRGATHDLTLNIYDYGSRYVTAWTFNTDIFKQATIERFAQQCLGLVQQILSDPSQAISRYFLVDQSKRAEILERAHATKRGKPQPGSIAADLVAVARDHPDRLALISNDRSVPYDELVRSFFAVRSKLIELGVKAGTKVAIEAPKVGELAIVALALLDIEADVCILGDAGTAGEACAKTAVEVLVKGSQSEARWAPGQIQLVKTEPGTCPEVYRHLAPRHFGTCIRGMQGVLGLSGASRVLSLPGEDKHFALATVVGTWASGGLLHAPGDLRSDAIVNGMPASTGSVGEYIKRHAISALAIPAALAARLADEDLGSLGTLVLVGESSSPPPRCRAKGAAVRLLPRFAFDLPCGPISFEWIDHQWVMNQSGPADPVGLALGEFIDVVDDEMSGRLFLLLSREEIRTTVASSMDGFERIDNPPSEFAGHVLLKTPCTATRTASGRIVYQGLSTRAATHRIAPFCLDQVEECVAEHEETGHVVCVVREIDDQPAVVAYVQLKNAGSPDLKDLEELLRKHLRRRLPEYMHPGSYVFLDCVPLTDAGFVDVSRLPAPLVATSRGYLAPRNEIEEKLAAIWSETLALEKVGVHDNFFELGGDSILGAVIISRASIQGLYFSPKDIFENTSISELASIVRSTPAVQVDQGPVIGRSPLAPAQTWFFERIQTDLSHFNQALLIELNQVPDPALLEQALRLVVQQHDVLRSRFSRENGQWFQVFAADQNLPSSPRLAVLACDKARTADQTSSYEQAILAAQSSLDIEKGELFKAFWLDCGNLEDSRLLIVVHHLAIDGLSWSVLLEDIDSAYLQLKAKGAAQLPLKTSSYKDWVEQLHHYAAGESIAKDAAYWEQFGREVIEATARGPAGLPLTMKSGAPINAGVLEAGSASRAIALNRELTAAFRSKAHQAYNTDANDLLLAALYGGFSAWNKSPRLMIDVEGHGREPFEGIDSSRTLGWFTSIYPVLFEFESHADKGALIKRVKQQLRDIPNRGIGYGILRHIGTAPHPDGSVDFSQLPQAPILFTYLGQLDQLAGRSGLYAGKVEPAPGIRSPRQNRTHTLDVCVYVTNGCLQIQCTFDSGVFSEDEIDAALANTQRELSVLIEHCLDPAAGGLTPSDMPDLDIDQAQLDELLNEVALLDE